MKVIKNVGVAGMKSLLTQFIFYIFLASSSLVYAIDNIPPSVSQNVHVIKNATPQQCTPSWNGRAAPETVVDESGYGDNTGMAQGVLSCTGCAIDSSSNDCVCAKCYSYFN